VKTYLLTVFQNQ